MLQIEQVLSEVKHPIITVVYLQTNRKGSATEEGGEYIQFTGMAAKYNVTSRMLQIVDKKLKLEDIVDIGGEELL